MLNYKTARCLSAAFALGVSLVLAGCANSPTAEEMTLQADPNIRRHQKSVFVSADSKPGIEPSVPGIVAPLLRSSVKSTSAFKQLFYGPGADYVLKVTVVNWKGPQNGLSMTADLESIWTLSEAKSKKVVMQETINSSYTAKYAMDDGSSRAERAINGVVLENIRLGLMAISKLKLD